MITGYEVSPKSRKDLLGYAEAVRNVFCDEPYFDIVTFLDVVLPKTVSDFTFEIVESSEIDGAHGLTDPTNGIIKIANKVYEGAVNGNGRDRLTLAHEFGHYLIHTDVKFARKITASSKPYFDSEWQANAFAGELLMFYKHLNGIKTPSDMVNRFKVSNHAAQIQFDTFEREGLIKG